MKDSRIKILFILPSLKAGGAERVMTFVATNLDSKRFLCQLLILGKAADADYSTGTIETHFLNKKRLLHSIKAMYQHIASNKPNIVIGSISHVNRVLSIFTLFFPKTKFVGREASVKTVISKLVNKDRIQYWKLYNRYHRNMDAIICQSKDMADDLVSGYRLPRRKAHLINNPITGHLPIKQNSPKQEVKQLITIGRLSIEKGYDRLLKILSKVDFPFHYTIIGVGDQKDSVFALAKTLHLQDKITYIPHTKDVAKYLGQSDLFLQGSLVEGFPNALLESCVVGTPVVAFYAPGGTREIVENGVNGYIAKDEDEFIQLMKKALDKNWIPEKVSSSVTKKFNKEIILEKYEHLFNSLITSQSPK